MQVINKTLTAPSLTLRNFETSYSFEEISSIPGAVFYIFEVIAEKLALDTQGPMALRALAMTIWEWMQVLGLS